MPAIITHDTFGREVYSRLYTFIGESRAESEAFLLGCQGPDPLFYLFSTPRYITSIRLGSIMHARDTARLLTALKEAVMELDEADRAIGRAYALGFLCHYRLDSQVHPFIYSQQHALTEAGVPGLSKKHGRSVHAVIESELDELVLYTKRGETIATFKPARRILKADDHTLSVISRMYVSMAQNVYGLSIPENTFASAVKGFRRMLKIMYSPSGIKRELVGDMEYLVRTHSIFKAMSHRNVKLTDSAFANSGRDAWKNPFTDDVSHESFEDLYESARADVVDDMLVFDRDAFDLEAASKLTAGLNFAGDAFAARILAVESIGDGIDAT